MVGNLLVLACMISIAGLVGETYVRFLVVETDSFGVSLVAKRWFLVYPELNSLYCRDREWTEVKPADVRRIAFVGDSFTYGWGINDEAGRFTNLIQKQFDAKMPGRVEVMNVAWSGWDTRDELGAVHDMIQDYDVDEVVLCYLPNDLETLIPTPKEFDPKKPPASRYINVDHSFLLNYLYYRLLSRSAPSVVSYWDWLADGYGDTKIWAEQERLFDQIVEQCGARDVRLRVVLMPFLMTQGDRYDAEKIHAQVTAAFQARGVQVLDLLPAVQGIDPKTLIVNSHDPHPNEAANRLFADEIWEAWYRDETAPVP